MKRKTAAALAAALGLSLLLSACAQPESAPSLTPSTDTAQPSASTGAQSGGGILSAFSAEDLEGNALDQSVLEGHTLTMVNVWATFCTPCISEMPELGELAEEYADKGVQIVGLISDVLDSDGSVSETQLDTAREIVSSTGANYTHIVPSADLYGLLYQITSVPTTFFVDETGAQVGYAYLGARDKDEWKAILDEMLAEADA
ncbi:TlpA disulfide reductase family protein [uncultured Pseudoflavonifractor sp.]|uniref:TlpA family protein disulfide reductase n=1 Tax=uncultured Pseudoflavonifractor sp. TaxID=1221379 RepID=UPI0025E1A3D1|nr:TlpA disulfide reductase family protein [uncultured Pseudoflavonifractor sp.]